MFEQTANAPVWRTKITKFLGSTALLSMLASQVFSADLTWTGKINNTWDTVTNRWDDRSVTSWTNGDNAAFSVPRGFAIKVNSGGLSTIANNLLLETADVVVDDPDSLEITDDVSVISATDSATVSTNDIGDINHVGLGDLTLGNTVSGLTTVNHGQATLTGRTSSELANDATFAIIRDQSITERFDKNGTIDATTPVTQHHGAERFLHSGDVVSVDTLTINAATRTLEAGALLNGESDFDGSVQFDGALINPADLDITGEITLTDTLINDERLDIEGTASVDANSNDVVNTGGILTVQSGGAITNGGQLINQNGGTFTLETEGSAAFERATNSGAGSQMTITDDSNMLVGDLVNEAGANLDVQGTITGNLGNSSTTNLASAQVSGIVTNSGDFEYNGSRIGSLDNKSGGTVTFVNGGIIEAGITNAGTLNFRGKSLSSKAPTTNESGGVISLSSSASLKSDVTNEKGAFLYIDGRLDGELINEGTLEFNLTNENSPDIPIDVENPRYATVGTLITDAESSTTINGAVEVYDIVENSSTAFTVTEGSSLDVKDLFHNKGSVGFDGEMSGRSFLNDGFATFNGDSAGWIGDQVGPEEIAYIAITNNTQGILTFGGTTALTGTVVNNGSMNVTGTLTGGMTTNNGTVVLSDGASANDLINQGIVEVTGKAMVTSLDSSGTLDLSNNTGEVALTSQGDVSLAGHVELDLDFSNTSEPDKQGSVLEAGGRLTINHGTTLSFNDIGDAPMTTAAALNQTVLKYSSLEGNVNSLTLGGAPESSSFEYFLFDTGSSINISKRLTPDVTSLGLVDSLTHSLIGTIVNRPTSPYVVSYALAEGEAPCRPGAWARVTGGQAEANGTVTSGGIGATSVSLNYSGFQFGGDVACFDGQFSGWDMAFGVIGGFNTGNASSVGTAPTSTKFFQKYGGVYITMERDRFAMDLQYRREKTEYTANNSVLGIVDEEYRSRANTLSGAARYSIPIRSIEGMSFTPSLGFSISKSKVDQIEFNDPTNPNAGSFVKIDDRITRVGFVGGTLSRVWVSKTARSSSSVFATANYYHDFSGNTSGQFFDAAGASQPFSVDAMGSFAELSIGFNHSKKLNSGGSGPIKMLSTSMRLDGLIGRSIDSFGLTGQIRLQF